VIALWLALQIAAELSGEFWGRTVPVKNEAGELKAVASESHLIVEVTVKAAKGKPERISPQQFQLKVNGAKLGLAPDTPGMAAAAIYYPNWDSRQGIEAQAGPVIIGRPQGRPRFPGDPNSTPPPEGEHQGKTLDAAMTAAALGDGEVFNERTGLLYFAWKGRVAKIKTLELVWTPAEGEARTIKLR
jgi:hypothetical protein